MKSWRSIAIVSLGLLLGGCVISKQPLLDEKTRAVPFGSGTRFTLYEREHPSKPWKRMNESVTLVADAAKVIYETTPSGDKSDKGRYTLHPIGTHRFLVQADLGSGRIAYGVLLIGPHDGVLSMFICDRIDRNAFQKLGGTITSNDCLIDGIADPAGYVRQLADRPQGPQIRYVPVRKR